MDFSYVIHTFTKVYLKFIIDIKEWSSQENHGAWIRLDQDLSKNSMHAIL